VGVDLVAVMGVSGSSVQTIITEIGTDMSAIPTVKHFCAWLGLAPRNDISGGKVLRSRTMKVRSRANQAFRDAAVSVGRSDWRLGVLSGDAGAARSQAGDCRDGAQNCTRGLSPSWPASASGQ
jgi:transposase